MSEFRSLAFVFAVIPLAARLVWNFSNRLGQPAVLGELLGPGLFDWLHLPLISSSHLAEAVNDLGRSGVLLLILLAGLELHLSDLTRKRRVSTLSGSVGMLFKIVVDQSMVDKILQATQFVVGDLASARTGILAVNPLASVYGLNKSER